MPAGIEPDFEVVIIGAGLMGIGVARELLAAGITDFVLLDRGQDAGGTWRDNTYPGVGVDVPTFAYQFSYFLKPDWERMFAKGHEVKKYIDDFVAHYRIGSHIQFGVEVTSRVWDDQCHFWRVGTVDKGEITARFVVQALGNFIERRPVEILGLDQFRGEILDPTAWNHDYDLVGKHVAVIGTGASAVQIIPAIAPLVAHLDVYQRTPIWVIPKVDSKIPQWFSRALARFPKLARLCYTAANRFAEVTFVQGTIRYAQMPWMLNSFERLSRRTLRKKVPDAELRRKLTPTYPLGAKRLSMSNDYLPTFSRRNVDLITDRIATFTPAGIRTIDGHERAVDAVVLATGFRMSWDPEAYRHNRHVTGRDGFDLATRFEKQRLKAYEAVSMPGLPNYFMAACGYHAVGGSYHLQVETVALHVARTIKEARRRGATCVEITPEATDRYHAMVAKNMESNLFYNKDCAGANTYYLDHHGDPSLMRPTSVRQAFTASRSFPLTDYRYTTIGQSTADGRDHHEAQRTSSLNCIATSND